MSRQQVGVRFALALLAALALAAAGFALAADPGSKDDPLATVSYIAANAQYNRVDLAAGQSLRLGRNAELIIVGLQGEGFEASEFNPRNDTLIDLSQGGLAVSNTILANHLYVNGSNHDLFFKFQKNLTVLLRGEWK
jgi:hypothetical protein